MIVHCFDCCGKEIQEADVIEGIVARFEKIVSEVVCHRPVHVFTRTIDAGVRLFVEECDEIVTTGNGTEDFNYQLVVVCGNVRIFKNRRHLALAGGHFVVTCFSRDT